jgi:hypothetical protein
MLLLVRYLSTSPAKWPGVAAPDEAKASPRDFDKASISCTEEYEALPGTTKASGTMVASAIGWKSATGS